MFLQSLHINFLQNIQSSELFHIQQLLLLVLIALTLHKNIVHSFRFLINLIINIFLIVVVLITSILYY